MTGLIILIIIAAILVAFFITLRILNKRAEKKQAEADEKIEQYKQQINMLVIDKKKMKLQDSGLPQYVVDQTPRMAKMFKVPIVKAKVGPKIMVFIADNNIFPLIPVKKEVRATISGLYITDVRGIRGPLEKPVKKRNIFQRMMGVK